MPLRERPGLGTVLNILVIGVTTDLVLLVVDTPAPGAARLAYLLVGAFLWRPGSGLYIGVDLGPGPRDGLMTGLAARGLGSIRVVRTGTEQESRSVRQLGALRVAVWQIRRHGTSGQAVPKAASPARPGRSRGGCSTG